MNATLLKSLLVSIRAAAEHPLSKPYAHTILRVVGWQISSRINRSGHVVPFVNDTRLVVTSGMTGATGSVYFGLHEYESMAFILHLLQKEDLFLDVGANVGSYSILASGVCGATTLAFEPVPSTFEHLLDNVYINRLHELVTPIRVAISNCREKLRFTCDLDTMNHVVSGETDSRTIEVDVTTIDDQTVCRSPVAIKLDVEGYEQQALDGARKTLTSTLPIAVIAETNDFAKRYGSSLTSVTSFLRSFGFCPYSYDPITRNVQELDRPRDGGNTLFLRNIEEIRRRIHNAKPFLVHGTKI